MSSGLPPLPVLGAERHALEAPDQRRTPDPSWRVRRRRLAFDLACRMVGGFAQVEVTAVVLTRRCPSCGAVDHGRPRVSGGVPGPVGVSWTYSGPIAVAAVGPGPVGIDAEPATRRVRASVGDLLAPAPDDAPLLRRWVRVEAVLKAAGTGIDRQLRTVTFESVHAGPWTWRAHTPTGDFLGADVNLRDALVLGPGIDPDAHLVSVAVPFP